MSSDSRRLPIKSLKCEWCRTFEQKRNSETPCSNHLGITFPLNIFQVTLKLYAYLLRYLDLLRAQDLKTPLGSTDELSIEEI